MRLACLAAGIALLVLAHPARADHAPLPESVTPLMATWLWGHHAIPGTITRDGSPYWFAYPHTDPARIVDPRWTDAAARVVKAPAAAPAVVFLHGCSGMLRGGTGYRVMLLEMGFAIFEPDAYARPFHTCERSSATARREEAAYALAQIRALSWIDPDRIVLVGFSEGGRAAALWNEPGYAAVVIVGARATPSAPDGVPVLAIAGADDDWASPVSYEVNWPAPSRAVLIEGAGHEIISHPEFKSTLREFLTEVVLGS